MILCVALVVRVIAALYLRIFNLRREKRKRLGRIIAGLHFKRGPIDCSSIEPRRRAGFQTAERKIQISPSVRDKSDCRRFADTAGGNFLFADVDEATQKCAGRKHHGARGYLAAISKADTLNAPVFDYQIIGLRLDHFEIGDPPNRGLHRRRI